jgi:cytochrome b6-f complex iron-sulfur subunit
VSADAAEATSRRTFLVGAGGLFVGVLLAWAIRRSPVTVADDDGWPTADLHVGLVDDVVARIAADGPLVLPEGSSRLAVVTWDPSLESDAGLARDRYGPGGEGHPVLDATTGLLALSLVSTHHGCSVPFCASSQQFEDPCHGSSWNRWGEWTGGPAPRGLDRYRSRITDDGELVVSLTSHIVGPAREDAIFDRSPAGPMCIDG